MEEVTWILAKVINDLTYVSKQMNKFAPYSCEFTPEKLGIITRIEESLEDWCLELRKVKELDNA